MISQRAVSFLAVELPNTLCIIGRWYGDLSKARRWVITEKKQEEGTEMDFAEVTFYFNAAG